MSAAINVGSRCLLEEHVKGMEDRIGYVSCNSADWGKDGEFCADKGLICKGA